MVTRPRESTPSDATVPDPTPPADRVQLVAPRHDTHVEASGTIGGADWSVARQRHHGGRAEGVEGVWVDNGRLGIEVLPTRGMGLAAVVAASAAAQGGGGADDADPPSRTVPFGWDPPGGDTPVHPGFVHLADRGGLGFLTGFTELLCRCGLASNGPPGVDSEALPAEGPLTLHGRIANTPAERCEFSRDGRTLRLSGETRECCLFGPNLRLLSTYETDVGSDELRLHDRVTNLSHRPGEAQMLYHVNLRPIGPRLHVAAHRVVPRDADAAAGVRGWAEIGPPRPDFAEQVFFLEPKLDDAGEGLAVLPGRDGRTAFALRFRGDTLPWFVFWKNTAGPRDGDVVGLEPAFNLPNHRTFERRHGRVIELAPHGPGSSIDFHLRMRFLTDPDAVTDALAEVDALQGDDPPAVEPAPVAGLCPCVGDD